MIFKLCFKPFWSPIWQKMKNLSIEIRKIRKKIENFWSQKFRVRHARYRISTPGTRCTRLKIFLKSGYIYITDFVFQNLSKFGGVNLTPPLRFWPERSRMTPKWFKRTENKLFWRIKQFRVWFWDDFWRFENFDLHIHNGPTLWWSRSKVSDQRLASPKISVELEPESMLDILDLASSSPSVARFLIFYRARARV